MSVKLLTEHLLEVLSLKGGCTGSSESTLVIMPLCWKSHVTAHVINCLQGNTLITEEGLWFVRHICQHTVPCFFHLEIIANFKVLLISIAQSQYLSSMLIQNVLKKWLQTFKF